MRVSETCKVIETSGLFNCNDTVGSKIKILQIVVIIVHCRRGVREGADGAEQMDGRGIEREMEKEGGKRRGSEEGGVEEVRY